MKRVEKAIESKVKISDLSNITSYDGAYALGITPVGIGQYKSGKISLEKINEVIKEIDGKQDKLIPGNGIVIEEGVNISADFDGYDKTEELDKRYVANIESIKDSGIVIDNSDPTLPKIGMQLKTINNEKITGGGNIVIDTDIDLPLEKGTGVNSIQQTGCTAYGNNSNAEGYSSNKIPEGLNIENDDEIIKAWGGESTNTKFSLAKGETSHIEGSNNLALGNNTHAEGLYTKAIGGNAHSEGYFTEAVGGNAHAEGNQTKALGDYSHSGGYKAIANGKQSLAFGNQLEANKNGSIALGFGIINNATYSLAAGSKLSNQNEGEFSCGTYNLTGDNVSLSVGNGTSNARSNAFKINRDGKAYYQTSCTQGADYAEMFEWEDGNVDNEDRIGYFVKINNDKISKATSTSNIIGVISSSAGVIGDNPDQWHSMYLNDEWGRPIYEDIEEITIEPEMQEDGTVKEIEVKTTSRVRKLNPEYDPSIIYESREKRKEWDSVGLLGKLLVRQDGTLNVGNHCTSNNEGIATKSETGFYVMKVISDKIVQILFK